MEGQPVEKFSVVHEKLFHAFIVSRDLKFFVHGHPNWRDGGFAYVTLPKTGMYRILSDFYPEASMPQLVARPLCRAPSRRSVGATLSRDYSSKQDQNFGATR